MIIIMHDIYQLFHILCCLGPISERSVIQTLDSVLREINTSTHQRGREGNPLLGAPFSPPRLHSFGRCVWGSRVGPGWTITGTGVDTQDHLGRTHTKQTLWGPGDTRGTSNRPLAGLFYTPCKRAGIPDVHGRHKVRTALGSNGNNSCKFPTSVDCGSSGYRRDAV